MSNLTLVIGESGSGKSTSLRNLDPKETFIIKTLDKPLPFSGSKKKYILCTRETLTTGNYVSTDDHEDIMKKIRWVNANRPDIKNLVIDDFQYTMCNEFMRRATEGGFQKFTEIGQHAWRIMVTLTELREDLNCFILSHSDLDEDGKLKFKTIGKLVDDKVVPEGFCTVLLHTVIQDGKYLFLTQNDGKRLAKSPMGMFPNKYIDNDLAYVNKCISDYENYEDEDNEAGHYPDGIPVVEVTKTQFMGEVKNRHTGVAA